MTTAPGLARPPTRLTPAHRAHVCLCPHDGRFVSEVFEEGEIYKAEMARLALEGGGTPGGARLGRRRSSAGAAL